MFKLFSITALFILGSFQCYSQVEIPRKPIPVEKEGARPLPVPLGNSPLPEKSKNPFINRSYETEKNFQVKKEKELNMNTDNGLLTAGDFIEKKWTEDKKAKEEYGKGQNLGHFITNGSFVEIYCRDHQHVDGDRVRVFVNGKMVHPGIELHAGFTPVLVTLESGFNTIEFEALNQGTSGPNTAAFRLIDDKGAVLENSEWNLLTGARATMIIVKQ